MDESSCSRNDKNVSGKDSDISLLPDSFLRFKIDKGFLNESDIGRDYHRIMPQFQFEDMSMKQTFEPDRAQENAHSNSEVTSNVSKEKNDHPIASPIPSSQKSISTRSNSDVIIKKTISSSNCEQSADDNSNNSEKLIKKVVTEVPVKKNAILLKKSTSETKDENIVVNDVGQSFKVDTGSFDESLGTSSYPHENLVDKYAVHPSAEISLSCSSEDWEKEEELRITWDKTKVHKAVDLDYRRNLKHLIDQIEFQEKQEASKRHVVSGRRRSRRRRDGMEGSTSWERNIGRRDCREGIVQREIKSPSPSVVNTRNTMRFSSPLSDEDPKFLSKVDKYHFHSTESTDSSESDSESNYSGSSESENLSASSRETSVASLKSYFAAKARKNSAFSVVYQEYRDDSTVESLSLSSADSSTILNCDSDEEIDYKKNRARLWACY